MTHGSRGRARKNLTTIYITHGHGDHFFGLNTILDAFPDARAVTRRPSFPTHRGSSVRS
jgi:glyoxylase-like metal-dependent hydrolase (beta-lactamase superfamily II)